MSAKDNDDKVFKPNFETAKDLMNESFSNLQEQRKENSDWFFPNGIELISIEVGVDKFTFNVTVAGPDAKSNVWIDETPNDELGE